MDNIANLFKKDEMGQLILCILFIIYLIMGYNTPQPLAEMIDNVIGKVIIFIIVILLFIHAFALSIFVEESTVSVIVSSIF